MRVFAYVMALGLVPGAMFALDMAAGAAAAGEEEFRRCITCHTITDEEGTMLAGRGARTGPNLYGVVGRVAGSVEGFRYGSDMIAAGEAGLVWDEVSIAAYLQNPRAYLQEYLQDPSASTNMSFLVRSETEAANIAAYLAEISPAAEN